MICNKIKHKDQFQAFKHIRSLKEKGKAEGLGVYYCASCNAYHVSRKNYKGTKFYG